MNQSNTIFFFLFAAYFVFITVRGELPKYMGFLLAPSKVPFTNSGGAVNPTSAGGNAASYGTGQFSTPFYSYNPSNNAQSGVSSDIGTAALDVAKIVAEA